jgi:CheY-like chemotaxis protein
VEAEDANQCLEKLKDCAPRAFLLDVKMPGIDGFELCRELRCKPRYLQTPILFLTAELGIDEIVRGYEAGANDYMTKPLQLDVVRLKLKQFLETHEIHQQKTERALRIAMAAMENGSEVGVINQFLEGLRECETFSELADHAIEKLKVFGVNAVLTLHHSDGTTTLRSTTNSKNTFELELLNQSVHFEKIKTFGHRCLFTFKHCSLLVRNMPECEDKAGRYRDHLASLLNGVEARMSSLEAEKQLQHVQKGRVQKALLDLGDSLETVLNRFKEHDSGTRAVLEEFVEEIRVGFAYLDLSEEQEQHLEGIVSQYLDRLANRQTDGMEIDKSFTALIATLEGVLTQGHAVSV